jgi:hypothetical protein
MEVGSGGASRILAIDRRQAIGLLAALLLVGVLAGIGALDSATALLPIARYRLDRSVVRWEGRAFFLEV